MIATPSPGNLQSIWTNQYQVAAYEVGPDSKLRIYNFFNYLQQIAWQHAEHLGFGFEDMAKEGLAWVLSQVEAHIYRFPIWDEKIKVSTWPSGKYHFLYGRDFEVVDTNGHCIAKVVSTWMLIDLNERKPKTHSRIDTLLLEEVPAKRSLEKLPERIKPHNINELRTTVKSCYSDLDPNCHVNTSTYVKWAVNSIQYPGRFMENDSGISINFLHEIMEDEAVNIYTKEVDSDWLVFGEKQSGKSGAFSARFFKLRK